jgi:hypothetical protein
VRRLDSAYGNRVHWFATLLVAVLGATVAMRGAEAAVDQREMKAREAFAVGQYQEALDLFAKLYAEKLHPNYLRNIGRCYQNLGDPDKAISSFREYLRKAKAVTPDERQEVEGYIKEMEDLKAKRQTASTTPPAGTGGPAAGSMGSTSTGGNAAGTTTDPTTTSSTSSTTSGGVPTLNTTDTTTSQQAAGADLTGGAQPSATDDAGPIYGRWWFWAIVVGVAAAGVGVAAAAGAFTTTKDAPCPMDSQCN